MFRKRFANIYNMDLEKSDASLVKLYDLCDMRAWDFRGTGHVDCLKAANKGAEHWHIVVRSQENGNNMLESKIQHDTVYQKCNDTLIICETCDFALSFPSQELEIDAIWIDQTPFSLKVGDINFEQYNSEDSKKWEFLA